MLEHIPSKLHDLQGKIADPGPALPRDRRIQHRRLQIRKFPGVERAPGVLQGDGYGLVGIEDAQLEVGRGALVEVAVVVA